MTIATDIKKQLPPGFRVRQIRKAYGWLIIAAAPGQDKGPAVELHKLDGPSRWQRWAVHRHYPLLHVGPRTCGPVVRYLPSTARPAAERLLEAFKAAGQLPDQS